MSRWRLRGWWPVAMAGVLVGMVAIAQRPRGGLSSVFGQDISPASVTTGTVKANIVDAGTIVASVVVDGLALKGDSLQTHTGGAQTLLIGTTGSGIVTVGNSSSSSMSLNGGSVGFNGLFSENGSASFAQASACNASIVGAAAANPVTLATSGSDCGITLTPSGLGAVAINTAGVSSSSIGNSTGGVALAGPVSGTRALFVFGGPVVDPTTTAVPIAQATLPQAGLFSTAKYTNQLAGIGAGSFVMKLCSDGATCAGGNTYVACTLACATAAGTITACVAGSATTWTATTSLTWNITTACATDPVGVASAVLINN